MKKIGLFTCLVIGLAVTSCASDKSDDPNAPAPSTDARDKFVAYWLASENSALAGTNSYTVNIIKSTSNSNEILINNFYGIPATSVRASVNNNIITIPIQLFGVNNIAQGTGTLTSATNISLNYTTTVGTNRDSCTTIYTKQ